MAEQIRTNDDFNGWHTVADELHTYPPALQEIAKEHLEKRGIEISPEHHQAHIDIARPAVPNIDELPPEEQDLVGELVEIGQEALQDTEVTVVAPTEKYTNPERLNKRIGEALASCEVETTPEVQEAIRGFYEDHYSFAEMIEKSIDGTLTLEECEAVLEKNVGTIITAEDIESYKSPRSNGHSTDVELPSVNHAATLLAAIAKEQLANTDSERIEQLRKDALIHASLLMKHLFRENALPITTLKEDDSTIVGELFDKLAKTATNEFSDAMLDGDVLQWGSASVYASSESKQELITHIEKVKNEFWQDTRMAGQLLYHNTGHLDGIAISGGLMSRLQQQRELGEIRTTTPDANPNGIHHSVVPHFCEEYSPTAYKVGTGESSSFTSRGTVAIPLVNVIEVAPFARDAQYTAVKVKNSETLDRVPVHNTVGEPSSDAQDYPGSEGGDRVFFASPTQSGDTLPDEYVIKLNGQRTPDVRNTLIFFGEKEIASSPEYGLGERFADRLHIQNESQASELIRQLQEQYIQLNQGKIVVPLRRGVFDFIPEGMEWAPSYRGPQGKSYKSAA